jgi:hypothetical protein
MGLVHHVIPLAVELGVVEPSEVVVLVHAIDDTLHPSVCAVATHLRVDDVPGARNLYVDVVASGEHTM